MAYDLGKAEDQDPGAVVAQIGDYFSERVTFYPQHPELRAK